MTPGTLARGHYIMTALRVVGYAVASHVTDARDMRPYQ